MFHRIVPSQTGLSRQIAMTPPSVTITSSGSSVGSTGIRGSSCAPQASPIAATCPALTGLLALVQGLQARFLPQP